MSVPRISLVIEFDNARYAELDRPRRALRGIVAQTNELPDPVEIVMVYDDLEIPAGTVKDVVDDLRRTVSARLDIHLVASPGSRYYQLKNEGARRARGEILVFVDSDVVPDPGWLRSLVGCFADPTVNIVMASPRVDTATLYGRIFALAWYFPLRGADAPLARTTASFVNSLAVRRSTFALHPFPNDRDLYIAQCIDYTTHVRTKGIDIYVSSQARISHPPPTFVRSAVINGHDSVIRRARAGEKARASYGRWRSNVRGAIRRILTNYRKVDLNATLVPLALGVAITYYSLWFLAEVVTRISPRLIHRLYTP